MIFFHLYKYMSAVSNSTSGSTDTKDIWREQWNFCLNILLIIHNLYLNKWLNAALRRLVYGCLMIFMFSATAV